MPNLTDDTQDRIDGRKWAEEVYAELGEHSDAFMEGFRRRILKFYEVREIDPGAMTDKQAREFGGLIIEFGRHSGKTWDECPIDYIEWLADQNTALSRYLRSRRVREEREEE